MKKIWFVLAYSINSLFASSFIEYINAENRFMFEKLEDRGIDVYASEFSEENLKYASRLIVVECEDHDIFEDFLPSTMFTFKNVRAWREFCERNNMSYAKDYVYQAAEGRRDFNDKALNLVKNAYCDLKVPICSSNENK